LNTDPETQVKTFTTSFSEKVWKEVSHIDQVMYDS